MGYLEVLPSVRKHGMYENELMKFDFKGNLVRTLTIENEPWFVAKDVCDILGLSNVSMSLQKLDNDEKLIRKVFVSGQERNA